VTSNVLLFFNQEKLNHQWTSTSVLTLLSSTWTKVLFKNVDPRLPSLAALPRTLSQMLLIPKPQMLVLPLPLTSQLLLLKRFNVFGTNASTQPPPPMVVNAKVKRKFAPKTSMALTLQALA
jgi:hypothetical protein